jgi:mycobactin phenyloxazoline synthetase
VHDEVADLLGIAPADLDKDADLIGQGLDSIRMMSLSGRWRKRGFDIDFATLAANPTVSAWAALLTGDGSAQPSGPAGDTPISAVSAQVGDDGEAFALAPMQHAMWVGRNDNQELGGVAGHLYVEFDGARVDPDRLAAAAAVLGARHPMLCVEFLSNGTQRTGDRPLSVTVLDLRDLPAAALEQRLAEIRDTKSHQQLDGAVVELTLTLLPQHRARLHVDLDMQAADAVSYRNLMTDLARLYSGEQLPPLSYTYREYRAAVAGPNAPGPRERDRQWWERRIPQLPDAPALPLVPRTEQADPRRSTRRWHWLDPLARDELYAAARQRGVTPAMAIAASFAGALRHWSSSSRFLLNIPMFGREPLHDDVDRLVGDFTSSLLLDLDLTETATAASRAQAVQDTMHAAAAHRGYSGLEVLRDLGRYRGSQVLASVVFTSAIGLGELFDSAVTDAFGTPVWILSQGPQVLLDAQVTEFDGGVLINWDVREDAFRPGVIDDMFAYHIAELGRLAADLQAWEGRDAPALTDAARSVRAAVNAPRVPPKRDRLHDGFFARAAQNPDARALYSALGELSYAQLREQALAVCATLHQHGVSPGDVVAVMGPKGAEQIPALLGIHAAGAAYLPVGVDQPAERAERILTTAGVRSVLMCGPLTESLPVPAVTVADAIRLGMPNAHETALAPTNPGDLAYVLFTSGSTGEPKGVELTHAAAMNTVEFLNEHFGIGPHDVCLALCTLECDLSVLEIFGMLRAGGSIVMVDEQHRRDPDTWARLVADHQVSVLHWIPGWLEMLALVGETSCGVGPHPLSSVRAVATGGDRVRPELVRAFRRMAPGVRFAGLGGATETAIHATICEPDDLPRQWSTVPYGRPFPNNACRVVAADGSDCPDWVPGELWVAGGIARGYRNRPDLTAERFVEHDGRTWYRTGDLLRYRPDGTLEFVGRADHRIKISGYRVELGEVEAALTRVAGVDSAVAAVIPADGGHHAQQLGAVVRVTDPALSTAAIACAVAEHVPPQMIPAHLVFVDQIPFTLGGKIDRAMVAAQLAEAVATHGDSSALYEPPRTALQRALCRIVAEVLGLANCQRVGIGDDFFSLGGDSVLATQTVARVRDWLDSPNLTVADIFATRNVAALAGVLAAREPGDRLEQVAEIYLEVTGLDADEVLIAIDSIDAQPRPNTNLAMPR